MQETTWTIAQDIPEQEQVEVSIDGSTWTKIKNNPPPSTPNRAARRASKQNMQRQMKHFSRMFVLICPACHKPYVAPVVYKCACPVIRSRES